MGRLLQARIDIDALNYNLQKVRQIAPGKSIIAMIKANGYGHGLVQVAKTLKKADAFGVACIEEALQLRAEGIKQKIVLCEGFFSADELTAIIENSLDVVVHNVFQVEELEKLSTPINIWIKIDTGMNRLGFKTKEVPEIFSRLSNLKHVTIVGVMTHFSDANNVNDQKTIKQIDEFKTSIDKLTSYPISMANSAAILAWPMSHGNWVRPGLMLYGVSPFKDRTGNELGLRQVMTLETNIISIKTACKGDSIGYSSRFVCPEDMLLGVIAIGYGDGYTAKIPDGTPVLVNGKQAKIVGQVSMDMAIIDLRLHDNVKLGDKVVLWGPNLPVEKIANYVDMLPYELLTSIGIRVIRDYGDIN